MYIIPVLDLCNGVAVHAVKGAREKYQPVSSRLCSSSNPIDVISCYLDFYSFKRIYIADLNAIEQLDDNSKTIESICNLFPKLEIWLDTGIPLIKHYLNNESLSNLRIILSTESVRPPYTLDSLIKNRSKNKFILSIDYKFGELLGTKDLLQNLNQWSSEIIILNLDGVGTNNGVKVPKQITNLNLFRTHNAFYGGGIKSIKDLQYLNSLGATGALISTSLHNLTITKDEITLLSQ